MEKFIKNVSLSLQQAYGSITIKVPELPAGKTPQQLAEDKNLVPELIATVVSNREIDVGARLCTRHPSFIWTNLRVRLLGLYAKFDSLTICGTLTIDVAKRQIFEI